MNPIKEMMGGSMLHQIISSHPHVKGSTNDDLIACLKECYECASVCTVCADACLGEGMVQQLTQCIRLNLDCADACFATGKIGSRRTGSNEPLIRLQIQACAQACRACADECEKHASMHDHCRICAECCRRCEHACQQALATFA